MSMIGSLIDELNKSADEWNGSNMFELARMCRDAADTIWQLRDDLQRANDAVRDAEHDESRAWDRVRKAERDNAKLRGLVSGLHMAYVETLNECESLDEGLIWECSGNIDADVAKSRAKFKADRHRFDAALRELGVDE